MHGHKIICISSKRKGLASRREIVGVSGNNKLAIVLRVR